MPKDAYYFSHDSNARNDQKIIELRSVMGIKGYGIYFCIIEIMREANAYQLPLNFQTLAYDIRESQEDIEDVVLNYDLFVITENDKFFHSDSLLRRMQHLDEVRVKRIKAGRKGGVANAIAKLKQNPSSKVKERKGKESISTNKDFEIFYSEYPKKQARAEAEKAFKRLSPSSAVFEEIIAGVKKAKLTKDWQKDGGQFIPLPATYLNQKRWEDEVVGKKAEDEWK